MLRELEKARIAAVERVTAAAIVAAERINIKAAEEQRKAAAKLAADQKAAAKVASLVDPPAHNTHSVAAISHLPCVPSPPPRPPHRVPGVLLLMCCDCAHVR